MNRLDLLEKIASKAAEMRQAQRAYFAAWLLWSDEPVAAERSLVARCDRLGVAVGLRERLRSGRRVLMTRQAIEALEGL